MSTTLAGKTVAILAADGFEQSELTVPRDALVAAGARVEIVSLKSGSIQGFEHFEKGESVPVDHAIADARPDGYDALVIPGGLFNPDALRSDAAAVAFTRHFFARGKPVGAICHGPWVLIDAEVVKGRQLTSVKSIRKDLENAGARWSDQVVIVDEGLITSRTPDDLPAFCGKLVEEIAEGRHADQSRPIPG